MGTALAPVAGSGGWPACRASVSKPGYRTVMASPYAQQRSDDASAADRVAAFGSIGGAIGGRYTPWPSMDTRIQLYPPIEPHDSGMLALDDVHTMYWDAIGNPDGVPVLFLHGGRGGRCAAA